MSISFVDAFRVFINTRTIKLNSEIVMKDSEFIKLSNKSSEIYHEIFSLLPESHKQLIGEYEETLNLMRAISDDIMYEHGIKDGVILLFH